MSKTLISVLILVVVIIVGYFLINAKRADNVPTVNTETADMEQTSGPAGKKMAFSEFIKQGGSYKCEVRQVMSDFENNGTVYVDGANIREDFSTIAEGRPMQAYIIIHDGYSYTWSSESQNMGLKTKIQTNTNSNTSENFGWNADQIGDYTCEPWIVEKSKFIPPANITFRETEI